MATDYIIPKAGEIQVKLSDGSVWLAKVMGREGKMVLIKQVTPPPSPPASSVFTPSSKTLMPSPAAMMTTFEQALIKSGLRVGTVGTVVTYEPVFVPVPEPPKAASSLPKEVKEKLEDPVFKARLSSIMLDNKYDRKLRGRTRGKLDMARLYKVPTQSRSLFTLKQSRLGKQYNVVLLVDESGSMRHEEGEFIAGGSSTKKCTVAAECAVFLAKAFEGIGLELAIVGFNKYVTVRKEFGKSCDYERVYEAINTRNFGNGTSYNDDYEAMLFAYRMLERANLPGQDILIMLSDGIPAPSLATEYIDVKNNVIKKPPRDMIEHPPSTTNYRRDTREMNRLAKHNSSVLSYGIGIFEGGHQIPGFEVVNSLGALKPAVINFLRKHIKRG